MHRTSKGGWLRSMLTCPAGAGTFTWTTGHLSIYSLCQTACQRQHSPLFSPTKRCFISANAEPADRIILVLEKAQRMPTTGSPQKQNRSKDQLPQQYIPYIVSSQTAGPNQPTALTTSLKTKISASKVATRISRTPSLSISYRRGDACIRDLWYPPNSADLCPLPPSMTCTLSDSFST